MTEAQVKAAARLYELRSTARAFWSDPAEYERRTKPMREVLQVWAAAHPGESLIVGFTQLGNAAVEAGYEGSLIALGAAVCDLLEAA